MSTQPERRFFASIFFDFCADGMHHLITASILVNESLLASLDTPSAKTEA
jgi:hypothetical protein